MVAPYKNKAKTLLQPDPDLSEVCYSPKTDTDHGTYDINHINRYRVLTGIKFIEDKTPYEELIRYLLLEQIKDRETGSDRGVGDDLNLAVWLIRHFCNESESDTELFSRAKEANFDTYCAFDADDIHEDYFSGNISDFDIEYWIYVAIELDEVIYRDRLIELYKNEQTEWNIDNLETLLYYEKIQKNPQGELDILLKLLELKSDTMDDWDYRSLLHDIAKKQIGLNHIQEAFSTVLQMIPKFERTPDWHGVNYGRFFMETCMYGSCYIR
jgi:hypothetical protein